MASEYATAQDQLIGSYLGNYRILSLIGEGGMARVYRAYQETLAREVAIKILPTWFVNDRSFVERFQLEARLVAQLSHPNIVTVHDANAQSGNLYIVMQLVTGGTLKQRIDALNHQKQIMSLAQVESIVQQLTSALAHAHTRGIVHRDVKPVNVLMDRDNRPILSDFGIAKVLASSGEQLTHVGAGVGTPEYMAPEQCLGEQIDARADIYSLGIILYEILTGQTPFHGASYPVLAHSHIYEQPTRPSQINPQLPHEVEAVIMKALMKRPDERFQSAEALGHALHIAIQSANHATEPLAGKRSVLYMCQSCSAANEAGLRYCKKCGTVLNACPACRKENIVSNRFCTKCGTTPCRTVSRFINLCSF